MLSVDHGEDKFILTDYTLLPTILKIAPNLPRLQGIIVLTDRWGGGCHTNCRKTMCVTFGCLQAAAAAAAKAMSTIVAVSGVVAPDAQSLAPGWLGSGMPVGVPQSSKVVCKVCRCLQHISAVFGTGGDGDTAEFSSVVLNT